jgi:signal transduction histidine kinase
MSGGIAHDFNNLLQAVLGNLELSLMKLPHDAPVRNLLNQAVIAAERAAKLSGKMLAYSGKGVYVLKGQSLTGLIEHNATLLAAAISEGITFDIRLDYTLPQVLIDAEQILQIIMNLVINASEAIGSSNGLITLSTGVQEFSQKILNSSRLEEKLPAGRYVCLEVRDSGCGMDVMTRNRLFDPFFTTKFTGRGLGMSAAQGIIRAHRGAILVESSPGAGTTIRVLFPIAAASQTENINSRA